MEPVSGSRLLGAFTKLEGCPKPSNVQCGSWQTPTHAAQNAGGKQGPRPCLPLEIKTQAEGRPERRSQGCPKKTPSLEQAALCPKEGQFRGPSRPRKVPGVPGVPRKVPGRSPKRSTGGSQGGSQECQGGPRASQGSPRGPLHQPKRKGVPGICQLRARNCPGGTPPDPVL